MSTTETSKSLEFYRTLVLNSDYTPLRLVPLSTLSAQEAICLVYKGNAKVLEYYDREVKSPTTSMKVPSVIVLSDYKKLKHYPKYSKYNVKLRDDFTCQYCGGKRSASSLTIDHVKPRSHGGKTTWQNSATACKACNHGKKNNPDIKPKNTPVVPNYYDLAKKFIRHKQIKDHKWSKYLQHLV